MGLAAGGVNPGAGAAVSGCDESGGGASASSPAGSARAHCAAVRPARCAGSRSATGTPAAASLPVRSQASARARADRGEIVRRSVSLGPQPLREEQARARRAALALDQLQKLFELAGDEPGGGVVGGPGAGLRQPVEPGEHAHRQPIVVALAGEGGPVGPGDRRGCGRGVRDKG